MIVLKIDRQLLETRLVEIIDNIKHKRKILSAINIDLQENNIPVGTFNEIARKDKSLSSLDIATLILVTDAVFKQTRLNEISPFDFFTDKELDNAKKVTFQNKNTITLPLELSDVTMVNGENYITSVKATFLVEMYHAMLIEYNYETQRSAKYRRTRSGVIPTPDVNRKSVADIAHHMLNGTYLEDMVTLNVYSDEVEALEYNPKNRILTINEGAVISILDGFHRLQGAVHATEIIPDMNQMLLLSIRNYDEDTARKYFGQINTINPVKKERLNELKSEKESDSVVRDLMRKSDLKGKIASGAKVSEMANQLTTFDVLSHAVDYVFSPTTKLEAKEIANYLIEFFNYLLGSYVEEFIMNPNNYRSTMTHPLMFAGYVSIAKEFRDSSRKLNEVKNYVDQINFEASELQEIFENGKGINNKKTRNKILDYFLRGEHVVK